MCKCVNGTFRDDYARQSHFSPIGGFHTTLFAPALRVILCERNRKVGLVGLVGSRCDIPGVLMLLFYRPAAGGLSSLLRSAWGPKVRRQETPGSNTLLRPADEIRGCQLLHGPIKPETVQAGQGGSSHPSR